MNTKPAQDNNQINSNSKRVGASQSAPQAINPVATDSTVTAGSSASQAQPVVGSESNNSSHQSQATPAQQQTIAAGNNQPRAQQQPVATDNNQSQPMTAKPNTVKPNTDVNPQAQQSQAQLVAQSLAQQVERDGQKLSQKSEQDEGHSSIQQQPDNQQAQSQQNANQTQPASVEAQDSNGSTQTTDDDQIDSQQINGPPTNSSFPGLLGILVNNGVLNSDQAQDINNRHLSSSDSFEHLLEQSDQVSEQELVKAKAELNQIPYVDVNTTGSSPEAMNQIDESVAKRHQVLPFAVDQSGNVLKVAMANPLNVSAINFIQQKTGFKLEAYYGLPSEIKRLISERYAQDLSSDVTEALEETSTIKAGGSSLQQAQGGFIRAAPINKIVNTVLEYAMQSRASDVHIEPMMEKTRVRYRIDGILNEKLILPRSVHDAVVSRIKILSDLKIDEKRVPQDGRFDFRAENGQEVDLRVSTCPSIHGEKIVMRLLKKNAGVPALEELGLRGLGLQNVRKAIRIPHGIFLVTGPTGSGKTTSLYSILNMINTPKVNIITLEDPVEYQMKGVNQVQVHPQAGLTFANGLRSFLRQDPDIIMVGEIRDDETAELAVQASLTGHLVFSTLHTNSAAGALPRLMDMQVEPFLLSSSMILAMGQRVVRKINPDYKKAYKPEESVVKDIKKVLGDHFTQWCEDNDKDPSDITLYRASEDRPQNEPEFKGRIGIFEVMDIADNVKSLINKEAPADEIQKAGMKNGMMLMKQDGYLKALEGITTIEEVLRVAEVK